MSSIKGIQAKGNIESQIRGENASGCSWLANPEFINSAYRIQLPARTLGVETDYEEFRRFIENEKRRWVR